MLKEIARLIGATTVIAAIYTCFVAIAPVAKSEEGTGPDWRSRNALGMVGACEFGRKMFGPMFEN